MELGQHYEQYGARSMMKYKNKIMMQFNVQI